MTKKETRREIQKRMRKMKDVKEDPDASKSDLEELAQEFYQFLYNNGLVDDE